VFTLNLYLDFSSVVAVTRDAELNEISNTNKNNFGGVKVSWEATPDLSDSVRMTTTMECLKSFMQEQYPRFLMFLKIVIFDTLFNGCRDP